MKIFLGFANRERLGNGRPGPGRSSRAERGTPRSYVKPRSRAARRVHLFSPELMRAPDARDSHMSVRAVQQKRCVKRELRCAHSRHSHAHSRDRRCQLAFSDNFHPSKGAPLAAARSASFLPFFVPFRVHFHYRAIHYCVEAAWRQRSRTRRDRRRRSVRGRPGFACSPAIKSRAIVLWAIFFFLR